MKLNLLMAVLLMSTGATRALAEDAKPADKKAAAEISKEERERMAVHHEKMAACLRSEKSVQACHEEMREACHSEKDSCPMMGGKHGMGRGGHKKK